MTAVTGHTMIIAAVRFIGTVTRFIFRLLLLTTVFHIF